VHHIIVNPVAGRGRTMQYHSQICEALSQRGISYTSHITAKIRDAYHLAKQACLQQAAGIIGIGGDGTIQEIVAGMVDAFPHGNKIPTPLGIFPGGSGNDFVSTLENAKHKKTISISHFANTIAKRSLRTVDIITANGEAFLNIGNIGIDAKIVESAAALKPKFGGQAYLAAVYRCIVRHKNILATITVDGQPHTQEVTLVAVCNGQYYGGGLHIAPGAKINDGKITLCIIDRLSRPKLMLLFPSLLIKKHVQLREVNFVECTEVVLSVPQGTGALCLDGNLYPIEKNIVFKILPNVLDVFI